jgi:hypothetical protein
VSAAELLGALGAVVQGAGVTAVVLLAIFIGVSVALGVVKLRRSGPTTATVRSLEEALGEPVVYQSPTTPHGTRDRIATYTPTL